MRSQNWVFFDSTSTSATSNELDLQSADGAIKVDVSLLTAGTSFTLKFQELIDKTSDDWKDIKAVNMGTFGTAASITGAGTYLVIVAGAFKVRAVLGAASQAGKVKVYGNVIA